jgi:hypothetical protein
VEKAAQLERAEQEVRVERILAPEVQAERAVEEGAVEEGANPVWCSMMADAEVVRQWVRTRGLAR